MLKKLNLILFSGLIAIGLNVNAYAEDDFFEEEYIEESVEQPDEESEYADAVSTAALNDYEVSGSLFERITSLEQEKVVMQLEKERAQLDLELERLNAEKVKLQMDLDTLSGRAEQQQQELQMAKTQIEMQTEKLRKQLEAPSFVYEEIDEEEPEQEVYSKPQPKSQPKTQGSFSGRYKLVNVIGADNQLQATVEENGTGQTVRLSVGKEIDGYTVKSISLNDGIVFEKDGETETLNIGK